MNDMNRYLRPQIPPGGILISCSQKKLSKNINGDNPIKKNAILIKIAHIGLSQAILEATKNSPLANRIIENTNTMTNKIVLR